MTIQTEITQPDATLKPRKPAARKMANSGGSTTRPARRTTKRAQLVQLLQARTGADVATISTKLGWQPHTTRAALTRLRKSGYAIEAEKGAEGKPTRYRITALPAPRPAAAEAKVG